MAKARRVFISFKNDNDSLQNTYCELLEEHENFVKIKIGKSILTLPYHRVLKIKEAEESW